MPAYGYTGPMQGPMGNFYKGGPGLGSLGQPQAGVQSPQSAGFPPNSVIGNGGFYDPNAGMGDAQNSAIGSPLPFAGGSSSSMGGIPSMPGAQGMRPGGGAYRPPRSGFPLWMQYPQMDQSWHVTPSNAGYNSNTLRFSGFGSTGMGLPASPANAGNLRPVSLYSQPFMQPPAQAAMQPPLPSMNKNRHY